MSTNARIYNRDKTRYQKIFKYTYWGGFLYSNEKAGIIENRDRFIVDYDIKDHKRSGLKKIYRWLDAQQKNGCELDHVEIYAANDGRVVVITSPYDHVSPSDFENMGWKMIYPLYYMNAYTFVKEIDPKKITVSSIAAL
jgi:hypothetical protein